MWGCWQAHFLLHLINLVTDFTNVCLDSSVFLDGRPKMTNSVRSFTQPEKHLAYDVIDSPTCRKHHNALRSVTRRPTDNQYIKSTHKRYIHINSQHAVYTLPNRHPFLPQHVLPTLHHLPPTLHPGQNRQLRLQRNNRRRHATLTDLGAPSQPLPLAQLLQELREHHFPPAGPGVAQGPRVPVQHVWVPAADVRG